MNKDIEIFKHISDEVSETIVLCKSNMYNRAIDQLFKISGELSILIKLKEKSIPKTFGELSGISREEFDKI